MFKWNYTEKGSIAMMIAYDSLTGMGKKVAQKLGYPSFDVNNFPETKEPIFLLTRSHNFGEITPQTTLFLQTYAKQVVGVAVSGNRNWGENFGAAGDKIESQYHIPLVRKYEASGFPEDILAIKQFLEKMEQAKENQTWHTAFQNGLF